MKSFFYSFKYAWNGILVALQQRNMIIHFIAAIIIVLASFYFKISNIEWCLIAICIGGVLTAETFNTAIEKIADFIQPNKDENIKIIKDLAAAAVLIFAVITVIVAGFIFLPKIAEQCF